MPGGPFFNCYPGPFSNVRCNIFKAYTSHCRYKGKFHKQLHKRRLTEWIVLFVK